MLNNDNAVDAALDQLRKEFQASMPNPRGRVYRGLKVEDLKTLFDMGEEEAVNYRIAQRHWCEKWLAAYNAPSNAAYSDLLEADGRLGLAWDAVGKVVKEKLAAIVGRLISAGLH